MWSTPRKISTTKNNKRRLIMKTIWKINHISNFYIGGDSISNMFHNISDIKSWDYEKLFSNSFFTSRKNAENFFRPYATKAYELFINDMKYNIENDCDPENYEYDLENYNTWVSRGFKEYRLDEMSLDEIYNLTSCEYKVLPIKTIWVIPWEYESDRIGGSFGSVTPVMLYDKLTPDLDWINNERSSSM